MAKASLYDLIQTTEDVVSNAMRKNRVIPVGTRGVIIEVYEHPEGYEADLHIPGDVDDTATLKPEQFEVTQRYKKAE